MKNNFLSAFKTTVRTGETTVEVLFKDAQEIESALLQIGFSKTEDYTYTRPNNFKYQQVMKIFQPINHEAKKENEAGQDPEKYKIIAELKTILV